MHRKSHIICLLAFTLAGCSAPSPRSALDWDTMDFADVHCDANPDTAACHSVADISTISKGAKGR